MAGREGINQGNRHNTGKIQLETIKHMYRQKRYDACIKEVKSTWMGRRPTLPDSLPVIGKSRKNNNVIYAFGHQHIGWTLGAVTGKIIDSLSKDQLPNIDISAYSPGRF